MFSRLPISFLQRFRELGVLTIALFLPLAFNPYSDPAFEPVKVNLLRWIVGTMVLACGLEQILVRWKCPRSATRPYHAAWHSPLVWSALIYGATYLAATAFSVSPCQSLWGTANQHGTVTVLSILGLFLLVSCTFRTREQISRIITALLLGSVPVTVYAFVQFLGLDPLEWVSDSVSPVASTLGRSNFLAAYLAMIVPYTLFRITCKEDGLDNGRSSAADRGFLGLSFMTLRRSGRAAMILLLQVLCVLLTQARAGLLALAAGTSVFFAVWARGHARRRGCLISAAVLSLGTGLLAVTTTVDLSPPNGPPLFPPPTGMSFAQLRMQTLRSRIEIWEGTVSLLGDRWLLGYGPETFVTVYNSRFPPDTRSNIIVDDPHNLLLDHLVDAGVVGLIAFLAVIGIFYGIALTNVQNARDRHFRARSAALLGSVTAFLVQAQFNPDIIVTRAFFWLALALSVASSHSEGMSARR